MCHKGGTTYNSSIVENSRFHLAVRGRTTKRPHAHADNNAPAHKHDSKTRFEHGHSGVGRGLGTIQRRYTDGDQGKPDGDEHVNLQHDEPFDLGIPDGPAGDTTIFRGCQYMDRSKLGEKVRDVRLVKKAKCTENHWGQADVVYNRGAGGLGAGCISVNLEAGGDQADDAERADVEPAKDTLFSMAKEAVLAQQQKWDVEHQLQDVESFVGVDGDHCVKVFFYNCYIRVM